MIGLAIIVDKDKKANTYLQMQQIKKLISLLVLH